MRSEDYYINCFRTILRKILLSLTHYNKLRISVPFHGLILYNECNNMWKCKVNYKTSFLVFVFLTSQYKSDKHHYQQSKHTVYSSSIKTRTAKSLEIVIFT